MKLIVAGFFVLFGTILLEHHWGLEKLVFTIKNFANRLG